MAAPKPKKINLLVQEGFENSQIGKILAWLLSVGRAIVIVVELVVICAFLSRFWFDRQLTDLIEQNNSKRAQVEASQNFENEFKSVQKRLAAVKQIAEVKLSPSIYIKDASRLLPSEVILENIAFSQGKFSFDGAASSESGLAGFIKSMEESNNFKDVTLANISLDPTSLVFIKFLVRAEPETKK